MTHPSRKETVGQQIQALVDLAFLGRACPLVRNLRDHSAWTFPVSVVLASGPQDPGSVRMTSCYPRPEPPRRRTTSWDHPVLSMPPGGNWRELPEDGPSVRPPLLPAGGTRHDDPAFVIGGRAEVRSAQCQGYPDSNRSQGGGEEARPVLGPRRLGQSR